MKFKEIMALSIEQLSEQLTGQQDLLRKRRFAHKITPLENARLLSKARRSIARIKTALQQKKSL